MKTEQLYLRPVVLSDALLLYHWRNEKAARINSFHTEAIVYEEHLQWLKKTLYDKDVQIRILMLESIPIGQIRLKKEGGFGLISYSIDHMYRSLGYGRKILQLLEIDMAMQDIALVGYVKKENIASQKVFESLNYTCTIEKDFLKYEKYIGARNPRSL